MRYLRKRIKLWEAVVDLYGRKSGEERTRIQRPRLYVMIYVFPIIASYQEYRGKYDESIATSRYHTDNNAFTM